MKGTRGVSIRPTLRGVLLALGLTILVCGRGAAQSAAAPAITRPTALHMQDRVLGPASVPRQPTTAAPLVLRGVTVIDVQNGAHIPGQTVLITGTRVRAIGPATRITAPRGARVVDARGKYLIPGLWDMHVHVELDADADLMYPLFVAYGVTGVRDAGSVVSLATFNRWKQEVAAGTRVGPRLFVAGPSITCPSSADGGGDHTICPATPSEGKLVVDFLKLAVADHLKLYQVPGEVGVAMAAEARRIGMPFGGHVGSAGLSGQEASDSGARFLDHGTWFQPSVCRDPAASSHDPAAVDRTQCAAAIDRLRRSNTWVVHTPEGFGNVLFPDFHYDLRRRYYPPAMVTVPEEILRWVHAFRDSVDRTLPRLPRSFADWQRAARSPAVSGSWSLYNYTETPGLPILAGTDGGIMFGSVLGLGLHEALASFVVGGMTPLEALQAATLNPAKALQASDSMGTVAADKVADLILLDADPLADIWNTTKIRAVVANGRYFDRAALDRLQSDVEWTAHHMPPRRP